VPASEAGLTFTGGSGARDLLSIAMLVLAAGLVALAQSMRRAQHR